MLFDNLPKFPPALPDDELHLLSKLPQFPTVTELREDQESACRRLERKGIVKVQREKMDPIAMRPTWFAGRVQKLSEV